MDSESARSVREVRKEAKEIASKEIGDKEESCALKGQQDGEVKMFPKQSLNAHFYKTKGFYAFFIPINVPYKKVYSLADEAGLNKKEKFGPIIESGRMFGFGWIGVEVEKPKDARNDVVHLTGEFESYVHFGPYKTLGKAYKKLMKERPGAKEFYNFYLDDPDTVRPEDCRTRILFR